MANLTDTQLLRQSFLWDIDGMCHAGKKHTCSCTHHGKKTVKRALLIPATIWAITHAIDPRIIADEHDRHTIVLLAAILHDTQRSLCVSSYLSAHAASQFLHIFIRCNAGMRPSKLIQCAYAAIARLYAGPPPSSYVGPHDFITCDRCPNMPIVTGINDRYHADSDHDAIECFITCND